MGKKKPTSRVSMKNASKSSVEDVTPHIRTTKSVYSAAKPLYLMSKLVGLGSFNCSGKEHSRRTTLANHLFVILCCVSHIAGIAIIYKKQLFDGSSVKILKLTFTNFLFVTASFTTAVTALITASTIFRRHLPRMLFKVSCVDKIFLRYGKGRDIYNRNRMLVVHLVLGFVMTTGVYIWDYLLFCLNRGRQCSLKLSLRWFASLTNVVIVFQLIFSSLLLRQKFKIMNLLLKSWRFQNAREGVFMQTGAEVKDVEMVRDMRRVYVLLHEASGLVSSHFGVPILLACTWLFLGTLTSLSFLVEIAQGLYHDTQNGLKIGFFDMVMAGGCLLLIQEVSIVCHLTSTEARVTGVLIQKLLVKHDNILHSKVERQLELLSCQTEKMQVRFSAAGFYLLDVPFFYGIIGVTCTYLAFMAELELQKSSP